MKVPVLLPNIFDHPFTYTSKEKLKIGDYVEVPFGKKKMIGIIWDDFEEGPKKKFKIKNIIKKFTKDPLENKTIKFLNWFSDYNIVPKGMALKLVLLSGKPIKEFEEKFYQKFFFKNVENPIKLTTEQKQEIDRYLTENAGYDLSVVDLFSQYFTPLTQLTMIFTNGILHAKNLEKVFNACGIKAKAYHSFLDKEERESIVKNFNGKKINVLISCGCLDEGFDLPDVKTIIDFTVYVKKQRRLLNVDGP